MWTYRQARGLLTRDGSFEGTGYSGHGPGLNSPAMQHVIGVGPCPQGLYTIGHWHDEPHLGPCVAHLEPDASNEMFGRSALYIHGDNKKGDQSGSDGCIVLGPFIRHAMKDSQDNQLQVIP